MPGNVEPHLERVLASPEFAASGQLRRFLAFSVQATLRGEGAQLKEYRIAREVFGRGEDYDPRLDPIVRVEARRLRTKLQEYYDGSGRGETLRIELPKGGYAAAFQAATTTEPPLPTARRLNWLLIAAMMLPLIAIVVTYLPVPGAGTDLLAVVPARWVWRSGEAGLLPSDVEAAEAITAEFANRRIGRVVAWPMVAAAGVSSLGDVAGKLGARRVLLVAVRRQGGEDRLTAYLMEAGTGQKRAVLQTPMLASMRETAGAVARQFAATAGGAGKVQ